ncbi:hypothetical protein KC316_g1084 [Hortaea werneckii]|uniref:Uncharacterized protein n=1 Tax=Hortaea werneckii TaxID=91943 RepID=A0A3M6YWA7_HORWE|nr:hypothetical protein KC324_g1316 [Hortaea werneckii]KAI7227719.1 hypothetical protein KC330_g8268 [Hortaea werneckii]KAI7594511.1 hypothetical protein KC316_g1084 [Hortaea werneckii]RMY07072.1 hypothetical protein D0868_05541 [Hortaea werneckii]
MVGDNPTLASAEEATGVEPLNGPPSEPQPPQHIPLVSDPTVDTVPTALQNLHSPFQGFVLALDAADTRTKNKDSVSKSGGDASYPSDSQFEDLVQSAMKPEGPVRAEEIRPENVKWPEDYREVIKRVETVGEPEDLKVFKVVQGKGKAEIFAVSLDLVRDRLVGVKFPEQS